MKILFTFIIIDCLFFCCLTYGQQPAYYFDLTVTAISREKSVDILLKRLDSLKSTLIPSRSSSSKKFNRSIDCGYNHLRIDLRLNFNSFQIDLLCTGDTICAKSLIQYINPFDFENSMIANFSQIDSVKVANYLKVRNKLYGSDKSVADLIKDISKNEFYAFYCGDGSPKTDQGKYINKLVRNKDSSELTRLLQSICVETQAYGVAGFTMLEKNGYITAAEIKKIILRIKKRNSEIVICSGCLMGLVENIYTKKSLASK